MPITLSSAELETIREIVGSETYSTVESLCSELNDAAKSAMQDDVDIWDGVKNKHLKMTGGTDGIDLDPGRSRKAIQRRVRQRLSLSFTRGGGLFHIPVGMGFESCNM